MVVGDEASVDEEVLAKEGLGIEVEVCADAVEDLGDGLLVGVED